MPPPFIFAVFDAHFTHCIRHKAFLLDAAAPFLNLEVLLWPVAHSPPDLRLGDQDFSRFLEEVQ